jgi:hypothetical protein
MWEPYNGEQAWYTPHFDGFALLKAKEKNCAMGRLVSNLQTFGKEGIRRLLA